MKIFSQKPEEIKKLHFIGAGGIGMSGLMECLHQCGFSVQGSDASENGNVQRLRNLGITVFIEHKAEQAEGASHVVVSSAIQQDNEELIASKKIGATIVHRADVLAEIMKNYNSVAVAGTHGKTSTTALTWAAFKAAGIDTGIINGGVLQDLQTNVQLPKTTAGWLIVEADESDRSFLKLPHQFAIVLNMEPEHMENYNHDETLLHKDFEAFMAASQSPDKNILHTSLPSQWLKQGVTYGSEENADYHTQNIQRDGWQTHFSVNGELNATVNLPGAHYAENATAALAAVQAVGGDVEKAANGLASFAGVARRFTKVGTFKEAVVVDDYGHHPTEIQATLAAARGLTEGQLIAVVQPHRYSRLKDLMDAFAKSTEEADKVFILPVHAAGEKPIDGVSSEALVQKTQNALLVQDETALTNALENIASKGDTILMMGAGSITGMATRLGSTIA
ncbi:MAG: UDP-N-acetylmuramate--L-alanine ligase [Alphaproteobacteria bacterium]|nr:UDP-N-acetylmuramate--L-alanine ligase [Alphaproteobacteria bacterium]MDD9919641.1 UDP-N-acetylmuramate--L-alanine ligase [Alphaproteobacteria bacterium]